MILYAVTKEGVYRHEIIGVYDNAIKAISRAENACDAEKDNWHEFDILTIELNLDIEDGSVYGIVRKIHNMSVFERRPE